jgi:branched-chain amino acid transport system substrate-binding protein
VAEASLQILGRSMPEGHIIGTRGDHWNNHPAPANPQLFNGFVSAYRQKYNEYPIYPCHHMAQAVWALKAAVEKAVAAKSGGWPSDAELAAAFRGLTFPTPTSTITLREDGQGLEDQIVGLSSFNDRFPFAVPKDMMLFPGAQVSAPVGQKSTDWLKTLKPDFIQQAGRRI